MLALSDVLFSVPPVAQDCLQILECANGLRPMSDLDPVVYFDDNDFTGQ